MNAVHERPQLGVELHDVHCRAGDWPHEGECVAFEGYEAVANPLLSTLASHGYARRADVTAEWLHLAPQSVDREAVREEVRAGLNSALCNGGHPDTGWSPSAEVDRITDAVLALLNGSAK